MLQIKSQRHTNETPPYRDGERKADQGNTLCQSYGYPWRSNALKENKDRCGLITLEGRLTIPETRGIKRKTPAHYHNDSMR